MPPTAAASRPPEKAPHIEANTYRGGNVGPDLSLGGSSVNNCTQTCLHTDPLWCIQPLSFIPRDNLTLWKDTTVGIFLVAVVMESPLCLKYCSLYKIFVSILHITTMEGTLA